MNLEASRRLHGIPPHVEHQWGLCEETDKLCEETNKFYEETNKKLDRILELVLARRGELGQNGTARVPQILAPQDESNGEVLQILKSIQRVQREEREGREAPQPAESPPGPPPPGWKAPGKITLNSAWMMWHTGDLVAAAEEGAPPTRVWPLKKVDRRLLDRKQKTRFDKYMHVMKAVDCIIADSNGLTKERLENATSRELGKYWGNAWGDMKKEWDSVKGRPNHHRKHARLAWISWLEPLKGTRKRQR